LKEYIGLLGGLVAVSVLLHYAWQVIRGKAEAASITTWSMWTMLDVLLLVTTWQAHKPVWLPLGWTVGASLVTISLLRRGQWVWSNKETLSVICTAVATFVWRTQGAELGIVAGTIAMTCAGIPLLIDMVINPIRSTFHVWFVTCIACVFTLLSSDWSFAGTFLSWGSLTYNGTLSILVLRQSRK
jgi:hypothetical protein